MSTSPIRNDVQEARAQHVTVTEDALRIDLPWYPRLVHGSLSERTRWRLVGDGEGIHWPTLDEDISVEGLLAGRRSGESQASLRRWLDGRQA